MMEKKLIVPDVYGKKTIRSLPINKKPNKELVVLARFAFSSLKKTNNEKTSS